ncbi:MAG: metal-dependent hydrolase [Candidatus Micrarchaeota archaeon]
MRFWQHLAIALAAAFAATAFLYPDATAAPLANLRLLAQIAAVTILGAALPDVDLPKTKQFKLVAAFVALAAFALARDFFAQRFAQATPLEATVAGVAVAFAVLGVIYVAKPRHRGVTHSLVALALFALAIFAFTQSVALAGFGALAFATHLAADWELKLL